MLTKLRQINPHIPIFSVRDKEFTPYGRVITGHDTSEIIELAKKIKMPENGAKYEPSTLELEKCAVAESLQNEVFGEIKIQIGLCYGYNDKLNALEYHKSSELNIAVTPMVLLLGLLSETDGNTYDSKNIKAFYAGEGETIELYGTSLHFCPCQTGSEGFRAIVVLPAFTNMPLEYNHNDGLLYRKNKWLMCHFRNEEMIQRKIYPGLTGENIIVRCEDAY